MAFSKSDQFQPSEITLANFSKSMSHPARIRIVALLLENQNRLACRDIVKHLPLAQSTVSQHIKELVDANILIVQSEGPSCYYSLDQTQLLNFCRSFQMAMGNTPKT